MGKHCFHKKRDRREKNDWQEGKIDKHPGERIESNVSPKNKRMMFEKRKYNQKTKGNGESRRSNASATGDSRSTTTIMQWQEKNTLGGKVGFKKTEDGEKSMTQRKNQGLQVCFKPSYG